MERKSLEIQIHPFALTWLERFAHMRGLSVSLAVESLVNLHRAETEGLEFAEPAGQAKVRQALAERPAHGYTATQLVSFTGLSLPTVRGYLSKLEGLGHVRSSPIKTRTNWAAGYVLTKPGRQVWINSISDPEERVIQQMNLESSES